MKWHRSLRARFALYIAAGLISSLPWLIIPFFFGRAVFFEGRQLFPAELLLAVVTFLPGLTGVLSVCSTIIARKPPTPFFGCGIEMVANGGLIFGVLGLILFSMFGFFPIILLLPFVILFVASCVIARRMANDKELLQWLTERRQKNA